MQVYASTTVNLSVKPALRIRRTSEKKSSNLFERAADADERCWCVVDHSSVVNRRVKNTVTTTCFVTRLQQTHWSVISNERSDN